VAKTLYLFSQNTVDCYKSFCLVSKFLIINIIFFPSWNIGSIIPLMFITYLALIYNFNIIKYIYFINLQQHAYIYNNLIQYIMFACGSLLHKMGPTFKCCRAIYYCLRWISFFVLFYILPTFLAGCINFFRKDFKKFKWKLNFFM